MTMFLRVDESFSALTLCHTIAAAAEHVPFSVDTLDERELARGVAAGR